MDELVGATGSGIEKILCYHLAPDPDRVGTSRTNHNISLFEEMIQTAPDDNGNFKIVADFLDPVASQGLWLLADGDDSGSSFQIRIDSISLTE